MKNRKPQKSDILKKDIIRGGVNMSRILVVDDDKKILEIINEVLLREGYDIETKEYIENITIEEFAGFDLILLDVMLPVFDGFEILKKIKCIISCPVIFLSAKSSEEAKVRGLMEGADDYITKPFSIKELVARIKVALRRKSNVKENKVVVDGLVFDLDTSSIMLENDIVMLTKNEFRICKILIQNQGQTFSKDMLYDYLYDLDADTQLRTITEYVYSIRKKFKQFGKDPIKTIWGIGYRWCTS